MKTLLLLVLAMAITIASYAQKSTTHPPMAQMPAATVVSLQEPQDAHLLPGITHRPAPATKSTSSIVKVLIGSSLNAYSVTGAMQSVIDYDATSNVLMHTHRGDPVTPGFATGNDIVVAFSADNGTTWNEKYGYQYTAPNLCRYPSGVIFNPSGSTNIDDLYSVVAGPITNGAWEFTYFGSRTYLDGNINQQLFSTLTDNELFTEGMQVTDNGICTIDRETAEGTGYLGQWTDLKLETIRGEWNPGTLQFDGQIIQVDPQPYIYMDPVNLWYKTWDLYSNSCYSKDGSIGYMWTCGVDARATEGSSFQPIIYKTLDAGLTWNVIDYFDFGSLQAAKDSLYDMPAHAGRVAPWFKEMDGVVDFRGNLHLFAKCLSAWSVHPDSLTYYFTGDFGHFFEFEYDNNANSWMGWCCDKMITDDVASDVSPYATAWDSRLQASINPDGTKVFAIWNDTDPITWSLEEPYLNLYPDVKVWGRDLITNATTDAKSVTYNEEGFGESYFMHASGHAIDGDGVTSLPITIVDIYSNGYDPGKPIFHYYLQGVEIADADFIHLGVQPKPQAEAKVSGCYPNPFSGSTKLNVTLNNSENVNITVSSITGQLVYSHNYGKLATGLHTLTIDGSGFDSGIYFCNVTVGEQQYTHTLIVK